MRPIENSPIPQVNNVNKHFTTYQEWRSDLANAYGQHCVYCNDRLQSNLQVEHSVAQSLGVVSPLVWDNLFLACGPCNLAKSAKPVANTTHYLPNEHNTQMVFSFITRKHKRNSKYACIPIPHPALNANQRVKAISTIALTELNRIEQTPLRERKMTDVRWQNRYSALKVIEHCLSNWNLCLNQHQKANYLLEIKSVIKHIGFFSLWINAFNAVPEVLQVIINALPNTSTACFDAVTFNPIARNPTNAIDTI